VEIDFWLLRIRIRSRTIQIPDRSLEKVSSIGNGGENGTEFSTLIGTNGFFLLLEVSNPEGSLLERGTRHLRHHLNVQVRSKKEDD